MVSKLWLKAKAKDKKQLKIRHNKLFKKLMETKVNNPDGWCSGNSDVGNFDIVFSMNKNETIDKVPIVITDVEL